MKHLVALATLTSTSAFAHLAHDMHAHTVDETGFFLIIAVVLAIVWIARHD